MDRRIRVQPINHLLKVQVVMLVLITIFFFVWQGISGAIAGAFGSFMVIANTLLQKRHLIAAADGAKADASLNLRKAYRCVIERWVLTIVMFVAGFAVLKLSALPFLAGFILTQIALLFGNTNRA